jgi:hypothetical protein
MSTLSHISFAAEAQQMEEHSLREHEVQEVAKALRSQYLWLAL